MSDGDDPPADVLAFWRAAGPDDGSRRTTTFDAEIRDGFLATYEAAAAGKLSDWENNARRRARARHRARSVSAQHVPRQTRAPTRPIHSPAQSPSRALDRGFDREIAA